MTLTDTSAPVIANDIRLNPGSLILTDFTHSMTDAGVPGDGDAVANIAWEQAAELIGSGSQTSLASTFVNTFSGAPYGAFERTSNGALLGVVSTTDQDGGAARVEGSASITSYLAANNSREYAVFLWTDVQRVSSSGSNLFISGIGNASSFSSSNLFLIALANSLGVRRQGESGDSWTPNGNSGLNGLYQAAWGNIPPFNSLAPDRGQSFILYAYHLVDVEASGMTYDELEAADIAAYEAFFAEGGRGYGDSRTLDLTQFP
ncbi:hypothetical protein KO516_14360 [Citreicella sp. C3M06]|uniref:hypothetical protein n=1 Tax=Citreicella sp. C3M06 TaxID=2841564 RepID=UPI001C088213|nr:hypothetical protein [Citreicella sp. C3M06]MBU2961970.1 hypothetical protein [Citreicella sp. C3M06]